jgi:hypothetical protein
MLSAPLVGQQPTDDGPRFTNGLNLRFPAEYRSWTFLASGLGMTYEPNGQQPRLPYFSNVFVNPSAYRHFEQTGAWPDKTVLVLEVRVSASEGSINKGGFYQVARAGIEAHVKDQRIASGWAFYSFADGKDTAVPMTGEAVKRCVECHAEHAAVDTTFVQFYPTLLDIARAKKTLKQGF